MKIVLCVEITVLCHISPKCLNSNQCKSAEAPTLNKPYSQSKTDVSQYITGN